MVGCVPFEFVVVTVGGEKGGQKVVSGVEDEEMVRSDVVVDEFGGEEGWHAQMGGWFGEHFVAISWTFGKAIQNMHEVGGLEIFPRYI